MTGMCFRMSTCAFALAAVACAAPAQAQFNVPGAAAPGEDYRVELGLSFWSPEPDLVIRTDASTVVGSDVDFVQEFGIEKKRFREFRATVKPGRKHKLRVDRVLFAYDEETVIQRTFVFNGQVYNVGLPVTANVEWDFWKFGYEWDFISRTAGFAGLVVDVKYNKVSAEIASPVFGVQVAETNAPVPGIGGIARGYFSKNVSVTGEFTYFKVPDNLSEELDGKFVDFDVYGTVNLGRNVGLQAGYRSITVDYVLEEDAGALKMKGPYFGGVVRF